MQAADWELRGEGGAGWWRVGEEVAVAHVSRFVEEADCHYWQTGHFGTALHHSRLQDENWSSYHHHIIQYNYAP